MTQAVILGLGSMFNHSSHSQNVGWERDLKKEVVVYKALRDIQAGEELCKWANRVDTDHVLCRKRNVKNKKALY